MRILLKVRILKYLTDTSEKFSECEDESDELILSSVLARNGCARADLVFRFNCDPSSNESQN